MVATLVRLRWRLTLNSLRANVWALIGTIVGALYGLGLLLALVAGAIYIKGALYYMRALWHHVGIIIGGIVSWRAVKSAAIARQLICGFHAGGTLVYHLNEVVVAVGSDGYAHFHLAAHLQFAVVQQFALDA